MSLDPIVTEYTIDPFPEDRPNGYHWRIRVRRSNGGWIALEAGGFCLVALDVWSNESSDAVRFDSPEAAIAAARVAVQFLVVGSTTWGDMVQRWGAP